MIGLFELDRSANRRLSASIRNYGDVFAVIFFHRRGAKGAEIKYFLFSASAGPLKGK